MKHDELVRKWKSSFCSILKIFIDWKNLALRWKDGNNYVGFGLSGSKFFQLNKLFVVKKIGIFPARLLNKVASLALLTTTRMQERLSCIKSTGIRST